jgi:hypothetical protein
MLRQVVHTITNLCFKGLVLSCVLCLRIIQGGSNMAGTNYDLFTHKSSRSYLNHLVLKCTKVHVCVSFISVWNWVLLPKDRTWRLLA